MVQRPFLACFSDSQQEGCFHGSKIMWRQHWRNQICWGRNERHAGLSPLSVLCVCVCVPVARSQGQALFFIIPYFLRQGLLLDLELSLLDCLTAQRDYGICLSPLRF